MVFFLGVYLFECPFSPVVSVALPRRIHMLKTWISSRHFSSATHVSVAFGLSVLAIRLPSYCARFSQFNAKCVTYISMPPCEVPFIDEAPALRANLRPALCRFPWSL